MDGAEVLSGTDDEFNMQGPNAAATVVIEHDDGELTWDDISKKLVWNDTTDLPVDINFVRNFDSSVDTIAFESVSATPEADSTWALGGDNQAAVEVVDMTWKELRELTNDSAGFPNDIFTIINITDSHNHTYHWGGSEASLQLLLIDADFDGKFEPGSGETAVLVEHYGAAFTADTLPDAIEWYGVVA